MVSRLALSKDNLKVELQPGSLCGALEFTLQRAEVKGETRCMAPYIHSADRLDSVIEPARCPKDSPRYISKKNRVAKRVIRVAEGGAENARLAVLVDPGNRIGLAVPLAHGRRQRLRVGPQLFNHVEFVQRCHPRVGHAFHDGMVRLGVL